MTNTYVATFAGVTGSIFAIHLIFFLQLITVKEKYYLPLSPKNKFLFILKKGGTDTENFLAYFNNKMY